MMKKTVLAMLAGVTLMGAAGVQAAENITLGRTILLEDGNHGAKIPLIVCRKTDAIKIRAERDLKLRKAVFTFQNGETRTINFYRDVKKATALTGVNLLTVAVLKISKYLVKPKMVLLG